jgi:hypothetical protein
MGANHTTSSGIWVIEPRTRGLETEPKWASYYYFGPTIEVMAL